jgi:hypothetical protein
VWHARMIQIELTLLNVNALHNSFKMKLMDSATNVIRNARLVRALQKIAQTARIFPIEKILLNVFVKMDTLKTSQIINVLFVIQNVRVVRAL